MLVKQPSLAFTSNLALRWKGQLINPSPSQPWILLAEDQPDDVFFLQRALKKAAISNPLVVARDGQEAVDYLQGLGPHANRTLHPFPSLLLLDIEMPRMDGFDVLAWLLPRREFDHLAVVVLSNFDFEAGVEKAKALGVDEYRVKPSGSNEAITLVQDLHARWLSGQAAFPIAPAPGQPGSTALIAGVQRLRARLKQAQEERRELSKSLAQSVELSRQTRAKAVELRAAVAKQRALLKAIATVDFQITTAEQDLARILKAA